MALACDEVEVGEPDTQLRHLTDDLEDPSVDVSLDTWLCRDAGGAPIGFAILTGPRPEVVQRSFAKVHPDHRGRGIGTALLEAMEVRARRRVPPPAPAPVLHAETTVGDTAGVELLTRRGFSEVRRFHHLQRPLASDEPDPGPPPPGLLARPIDRGRDVAAVRDLDLETFDGSFGYEPLPVAEWERSHLAHVDPASMLVMDGKTPVAFSLVIDGEPAWVEVLGVSAGYRRRGIATWLLRRAFADLSARGRTMVRLNVDATNEFGATELYAGVGLRVRRSFIVFELALT